MNQYKGTSHFKDIQSGYHRSAVRILAEWINGNPEHKFYLSGKYYFVADVVSFTHGILNCVYEVVYKHPFTGKKLGKMQLWSYINAVDLTVYEVSADWILSQTKKPDYIQTMECYTITVF